jgi:hypothetical protein
VRNINRVTVQAALGKKLDPISKLTRREKVEIVTQAVEQLPRKHEALSSNPSTAKKKEKKTLKIKEIV